MLAVIYETQHPPQPVCSIAAQQWSAYPPKMMRSFSYLVCGNDIVSGQPSPSGYNSRDGRLGNINLQHSKLSNGTWPLHEEAKRKSTIANRFRILRSNVSKVVTQLGFRQLWDKTLIWETGVAPVINERIFTSQFKETIGKKAKLTATRWGITPKPRPSSPFYKISKNNSHVDRMGSMKCRLK